jgi:hypothetical protein
MSRIKQFIDNFLVDFKRIYIKAKDKPPHHVNASNITIFESGINNIITPEGLEKAVQQWDLIRAGALKPFCTGSFETVFGVPCCHIIRDLIHLELKVRPDHFHRHWFFKRPGTTQFVGPARDLILPQVLPPAIVRGKGRPHNDNSTRRLPSAFERNAPSSSRPISQAVSQVTTSRLVISATMTSSPVHSTPSPVHIQEISSWQTRLTENVATRKIQLQQQQQ